MESIYPVIIGVLLLLAVFDLFVGVSNDAVNFLNSAVGSRIAPFRFVMLIASLGVLIGATFSSGMMEIARSGVFNPQMFTFSEIMIVFFAVMIADVFLLDIFNSLGLPTSTTVSIVFDLLGGAVAAAIFKISSNPEIGMNISEFINNQKAFAIIAGILISVVVAFISGALVQYLMRLLFTFKYENTYKYFGAPFGGIALTAIFYFLVMKGAKGASFMRPEYIEWINHNTFQILLYTFIALTAFFQVLILFFRTNVFRIVILAGTFALAFAFAGNDLVNFVGVPLAALDSYTLWSASGVAADAYTMESLLNPVQTPTVYLAISGMIMVLTLMFSKKARRVIQTSINLSSSSRGAKEQFGSSLVGRAIVRSSFNFGKFMHQIFPQTLFDTIDTRMEKPKPEKGVVALPFDHIRASVNLVLASILIASATSLKLPLSTTYVTFMVAMGSSLADGAWDRESAVYRISGVLTVIGGWFMTAICAFTLTGLVALGIFFGGEYVALALVLIVLAILIKSNFFPKKRTNEEQEEMMTKVDKTIICNNVNTAVATYLDKTVDLYKQGMEEFLEENLSSLRKTKNATVMLQDEISNRRGEYYRFALVGGEDKVDSDARYYYYRVFTNLKEIGHGLRSVMGTAYNHINNNHSVYSGELRENLYKMIVDLEDLKSYLGAYGESKENNDNALIERSNQSLTFINNMQHLVLESIDKDNLSLRSSELYLNYLQFARDIVNRFVLIALLQHELNEKVLKAK